MIGLGCTRTYSRILDLSVRPDGTLVLSHRSIGMHRPRPAPVPPRSARNDVIPERRRLSLSWGRKTRLATWS
jgi:hypothetical protein